MSRYRIFETSQFSKDLAKIAHAGRAGVSEKLRLWVYPQLSVQPQHGANIKKLKGFVPETWRYRIGSWRFFYEIDEKKKVVSMTAASHRASAY